MSVTVKKGTLLDHEGNPMVISQLTVRPVIRQATDIADFRAKHKIAEFILNPNRVGLYDLYDESLIDAHLRGLIGKRLRAVRNKHIRFVKDKVEVEDMDDFIKSKVFRYIRKRIFDTQAWGIMGLEFIPGKEVAVKEIPRKHIKPHLKLITKEQLGTVAVDGGDYEKNPLLWVKENEDDTLGFLLSAVPWAIYKRGAIGDWAQYIELFGQPLRIGKYNAYDVETRAQLEQAMEKAGSALSMMIPKEAEIDIKDGKTTNANGELQEKFKNTCDEQLSILILGQTETTKSSASSGYAQSNTHQEQQLEITKDDMDYELDMLNDPKFLAILKTYGLPVEGGRFEHEDEANPLLLQGDLAIDEKLIEIGLPLSDDYFYTHYKRPKPDNYEQLKKEKQAAQSPTTEKQPNPGKTNPKAEKVNEDDPEDLLFNKPNFWYRFRQSLADFFDQPRQ